MTFHTLGFLFAILFVLAAASWIVFLELERRYEKRRQERIRQGRELTRTMRKLMEPFR